MTNFLERSLLEGGALLMNYPVHITLQRRLACEKGLLTACCAALHEAGYGLLWAGIWMGGALLFTTILGYIPPTL
jgi:hypothetical protein